jgi:NADH-quinone oxidoreductase subunit J
VTAAAAAFYVLAAVVLGATAVAVTRREPLHAVVWLVFSVLATALLFALLGAPLLAALEVVVYAGGILVLFLFVILMLKAEPPGDRGRGIIHSLRRCLPAAAFVALFLAAGSLVAADRGAKAELPLAQASPRVFGAFLFSHYAVAVEISSTLLFVALVGALYLGRVGRGEGG